LTPGNNSCSDFPENQSNTVISDCSRNAQNLLDLTVRICPGMFPQAHGSKCLSWWFRKINEWPEIFLSRVFFR